MTLTTLLARVRTLLLTDNEEDVEQLLAGASQALHRESSPRVLLEFAEVCHAWGPDHLEEAALRRSLQLDPTFDAMQRLLDLLQQRLNELDGQERLALASECLRLGDAALSLRDDETGPDWANIILCRGLRRVELARGGETVQLGAAEADIRAYLGWLEAGVDVPEHWNRAAFISDGNIELAEVLLLASRTVEAGTLLEQSIAAMEARGAPKWRMARPYELLELTE